MSDWIFTPCPHCGGHGPRKLTGIYAETLELLRQASGEIHGAALAAKAGCPATAMNNRLARLEELGLATSRRYGRQRLFRANTPQAAFVSAHRIGAGSRPWAAYIGGVPLTDKDNRISQFRSSRAALEAAKAAQRRPSTAPAPRDGGTEP